MKRKVVLHGHLSTFGKEFRMNCLTVGDAIRLFKANFGQKFVTAIKQGTYQIILGHPALGGIPVSLEMINTFNLGPGELHIVPVIEGSGGNNMGLILGVAIMVAATIATAGTFGAAAFASMSAFGTSMGATVGLAGITAGQVFAFGAALAFGGLVSMLTPKPKLNSANDREDEKASFMFNGAINTKAQGHPIPVIYGGPILTGSIVASAGLKVEQMAT